MKCPECNSENTMKAGVVWSGRKKVQRHQCKDCGRIYTEIIEQAVT